MSSLHSRKFCQINLEWWVSEWKFWHRETTATVGGKTGFLVLKDPVIILAPESISNKIQKKCDLKMKLNYRHQKSALEYSGLLYYSTSIWTIVNYIQYIVKNQYFSWLNIYHTFVFLYVLMGLGIQNVFHQINFFFFFISRNITLIIKNTYKHTSEWVSIRKTSYSYSSCVLAASSKSLLFIERHPLPSHFLILFIYMHPILA